MSFDLPTIAIFGVIAVLYAALLPARMRGWVLMGISVVTIYWLQPPLQLPFADFLLPTMTLIFTVGTWYLTRAEDQRPSREDGLAFGVVIALILALSLFRFVPFEWRILVPSRPPNPAIVIGFLVVACLVVLGISRLPARRWQLLSVLFLLIGVFVVLKTEPFAILVSQFFRSNAGRDVSLASTIDLNWLGFSYVAFRLIHTVRDRQNGLLPELTLREYVTYVVFFPAFISGPIDRAERFREDFRALPEKVGLDAARLIAGMERIAIGLFKKFVIADSLAQGMALDPINAMQATNTLGMWLLLYGYALRLFFDFSGYTDIAIGIGILFGIKLPENFANPYMRTSITTFWQSWHKTLSDWARFYVFSPLSRNLLRRKFDPSPMTNGLVRVSVLSEPARKSANAKLKISPTLVVLLSQLATMVTIGLWHGVTLNFLIWGIWHGIGLWLHKQWTDRTRKWYRELKDKPNQQRAHDVVAWFVTFHFVVLGWVWFALPEFGQALHVFSLLFGGTP